MELQKEDRRVRLTKKILKSALIELMSEKSIHEISIKSICELADVNRSTFYHHYDSPFELYNDMINDVSEDLGKIVESSREQGEKYTKMLTSVLTYAEAHRDIFLVMLSDRSNLNVGEAISRNVSKFIDKENKSELTFYCAQFITAGMASIIWLWLKDENRRSAREVALVLNTLIMHGVAKAIALTNGSK